MRIRMRIGVQPPHSLWHSEQEALSFAKVVSPQKKFSGPAPGQKSTTGDQGEEKKTIGRIWPHPSLLSPLSAGLIIWLKAVWS